MLLLVPTGVEYRFRRVPVLTLLLGLLICLGFSAQQLYWGRGRLPGGLATLSALGAGNFGVLFSPGNAVWLALAVLMLTVVVSATEDALGTARFALIYVVGVVAGLGLFVLLAREAAVDQAGLTGVAQRTAMSFLLGVGLVRLYGVRVRTAYLLIAPRASRAEVVSLPILVLVPLWFALPAGVALWQNQPRDLLLTLAVNGGSLVLGLLLALLLGLERERLGDAHVAEARLLRQTGSPSAAADYLRRALKHRGDGPQLRTELAECYVEMGRETEAGRHFRRAIEQYLQRGERLHAAQTYLRLRHLLPAAPLPPALELRLANVLAALEWDNDATAAFGHVYQEGGDSAEARAAALQAADSFCRSGQPAKALGLLKKARLRHLQSEAAAAIDDGIRRCERMLETVR